VDVLSYLDQWEEPILPPQTDLTCGGYPAPPVMDEEDQGISDEQDPLASSSSLNHRAATLAVPYEEVLRCLDEDPGS